MTTAIILITLGVVGLLVWAFKRASDAAAAIIGAIMEGLGEVLCAVAGGFSD